MIQRFIVFLILAGAIAGCSHNPFRSSGFGHYYGGQGPGPKPTSHIPGRVGYPER
jgi:hypothetical protein